jgi:hypothetical protein
MVDFDDVAHENLRDKELNYVTSVTDPLRSMFRLALPNQGA